MQHPPGSAGALHVDITVLFPSIYQNWTFPHLHVSALHKPDVAWDDICIETFSCPSWSKSLQSSLPLIISSAVAVLWQQPPILSMVRCVFPCCCSPVLPAGAAHNQDGSPALHACQRFAKASSTDGSTAHSLLLPIMVLPISVLSISVLPIPVLPVELLMLVLLRLVLHHLLLLILILPHIQRVHVLCKRGGLLPGARRRQCVPAQEATKLSSQSHEISAWSRDTSPATVLLLF